MTKASTSQLSNRIGMAEAGGGVVLIGSCCAMATVFMNLSASWQKNKAARLRRSGASIFWVADTFWTLFFALG